MVTVDHPGGMVAETVLQELLLTAKNSAHSEETLKATQQQLQALNLAIAEGKNDRQTRAEAEKKVRELAQQVQTFEKQVEVALEIARQAREAAGQAPAGAARDLAVAREEAQHRIEKATNAQAHIVREAKQELERAVAAGKDDRESVVAETERRVAELVREVEGMKERDQRTLETAKMMREAPTVARDQQDAPSHRSVGQDPSMSMKWVKVRHEAGPLEPDKNVLKILIGVRDRDPLNLLTIVGAARHGKSFLMNALTGSDNVFRVSPEAVACTAGADLSPILMPLSDFKRAGGGRRTPSRPSSSAEPTVAFVDMEGQGDKSEEHDVRLAAPFLLLSKVVIFNWMGLPNKNTMLQELVVMVKAAEKVMMGGEDESRPTFGHLIILMRDVDGKVDEVEKLVLGREDTKNLKLKQKKDPMERNMIREGLKDAFESIAFHTMPAPHPRISDGAVPLSEVVPDFVTSLDQLRGMIAERLCAVHTFAGKEIAGGVRLNDIVAGLCESVNRTDAICPPSVLEAIDIVRATQEVHNALARFDDMLGSILGGDFCLSTRETESAINKAREAVMAQYEGATKEVSAGVVEEKRQELEKQMSSKAEVVARNQEAKRHELDNRIRAIVFDHKAGITVKSGSLGFPLEHDILDEKWAQLVDSHFRDLEREITTMVTTKDTGGNVMVDDTLLEELGWGKAGRRIKFEGLLEDTHAHAQAVNRSATAGKEDRRAREEAEKKMERLGEQAENMKEEARAALKEAEKAREAAAAAQAKASRQASLPLPMLPFFGGGGGVGFPGGAMGIPVGGLGFPGGVFGFPGGGMGFPGGGLGFSGGGGSFPGMTGGAGLSGGKFFKGGQIGYRGVRAPAGGMFMYR